MNPLLVSMLVVLSTTLLCGWIARRLGQASVIGEMTGGILLGPTLLGRLVPSTWHALFTPTTLSAFDVLSTLGLVLYLFLIGSSLDYSHMHQQKRTAAAAGLASLLLPFVLGVMVAKPTMARFPTSAALLPFTLFLGISLSITAFPVLARILEERGLTSTPLGVTALLCAAADDVCAWMLLAVAMSIMPHNGSALSMPMRMMLFAAYLLVMFVVTRLARTIANRYRERSLPASIVAGSVLVALLSAATTDALGLHPLFGAFVAGLAFPRIPKWQKTLNDSLQVPVTSLLLPFFFALTGLRTRLDLLQGSGVLSWTLLLLLLAVVGKIGGGVIAARPLGESWRNAFALGAMLNTRGLVELIVLNIAYTQGVFGPTLFAALVVVALVTTIMTSPLLTLLSIDHNSIAA
ncbi:cation:proton antiporter [Terriglobus roseus]|uniref:Kef-type K+ transport system, membrane component KefB n=1 Tax=Terriglobus roseus TaxID=392734 RepID=A0A1G7M7P4_9BACT|nr:cation:proton antiporter [Terriglobus roseus]SDF57239.1 Kef-type K+ transport system, membrane component KefB [Terriglobus roseus]